MSESQLFDQVRRFKVHDDAHSGYVPVVIGWWDRRGYTFCLDHEPDPGTVLQAIDCDNSAAEDGACDFPGCGVSILGSAAERAGRRELFPSSCPRCDGAPGRLVPS